ncbi:ABC transporter substrate-binding protein [Lacisediminihabitans changchengi]|uniref:ABC transporter substrate-binding protein n=1 Tax=Lacisediminihabitans changchengi TaxID=2787634 RepID=A0A934SM26_9MICO|nr:ABC transporter substrate-binding protein [Lacisediminihabitans changchengi]MBK4347457.1 ABC transporter substrate-binding protein [Lacisediminihabitans changchengi]
MALRHFGKKSLAFAGIAVTAALILSGCTGGGTDSSSLPTVDVGLVLEPTNLDIRTTTGIALDQVLIDNVYQGLVGRTSTNDIVDVIAKSHSVSKDGLTYTFPLNTGITFDDGNTLTADDVVWSIDQVRTNAKYAGNADLANVTSVTKDGDNTVVLTLSKPNSNLLWALSGRAGLVLEKAAKNKLNTTAIGTGPYKLSSWKQGDSLTLVRNPDYWGDKAKVGKIVFRYITDASAQANALVNGDTQVQTQFDATLTKQLDSDKDLVIHRGKTTDKYTLAFNNAVAPFTDIRVRQAIRQAIDVKAILKTIGGAGVAQGGPIPEIDPGYENLDSVDAYDPANAKKLLAEAGQTNLNLTLTIPNFYGTTVADVLVSQLAAVGITLKVNSVEFATWLTDVYTNHDFQLSYVDHAESHDFGNWANPKYYFGYSNPQVDALYTESLAATDPAVAAAKLKQAAKLVAEDAPAEWLFTATTLTVIKKGISGFPTDSTSARLNLAKLSVKG